MFARGKTTGHTISLCVIVPWKILATAGWGTVTARCRRVALDHDQNFLSSLAVAWEATNEVKISEGRKQIQSLPLLKLESGVEQCRPSLALGLKLFPVWQSRLEIPSLLAFNALPLAL
ncbi:Hypothetical predicted protein [Olea europaea subsp. europaea]|uniref:Uncharacterized protein n=1 Tax=Olea europaea subsp. europaea TaxID=158383 RepID=A0A8S0V3X2_OLEEU|nr:Hypothetical predicted protein [Olea europaea subsp. europaea]